MKDKEKFERYCAFVLDYVVDEEFVYDEEKGLVVGSTDTHRFNLRAYDDLNQMAEVVEKLIHNRLGTSGIDKYNERVKQFAVCFSDITTHYSIKQAFRDFIISTIPEET